MVEYFSLEGVPGQYFKCPSLGATLAVERCKTMYGTAKSAKTDLWLRMDKCKGCDVGAGHCGEKPVSKYDHALSKKTCVRCHEFSARLTRHGVCISCYNRQAEVESGRNGKGGKPKPFEIFWSLPAHQCKTVLIHRVNLTVVGRISLQMPAATTLEAALTVLRRDPAAMFRRSSRGPGVLMQPSLFGGIACRQRVRRMPMIASPAFAADQLALGL